jgi:predicted permease
MSIWRQVSRGVRALMRRADTDRDVDDEVQHYVDQATAAHVARGLLPEAARRAAMIEVGNPTVVRERVRDYGWENIPASLACDIALALRRLRKSPNFTVVAVLTLALGIGAATAIFGAVNPILFEPLAYPRADRVVMVSDVRADGSRLETTYGTFVELSQRSRDFEALAASDAWQPALSGDGDPERLVGQRVSATYFRALGIAPMLGRAFTGAEDQPGGANVVIVSAGLAARRFGGAATIIGRVIHLQGDPYTVIGVMPAGFDNVLSPRADVWAPLRLNAHATFESREWGHHQSIVGRLAPGITVERARRDLDAIARTPVADFPRPEWAKLGSGFLVHSLQYDVTSGVRPALLAILGAVALLLAIACVNVTNLLLARGAQRTEEFAMRVALGAGRSRLVRQLLTESLVLAVCGGALAFGVAAVGVQALEALTPPDVPRAAAMGLDGRAFAFAFVVTAIIGLGVGVVPALRASRVALGGALQRGSRRLASGHAATRRLLVVAEVALALVLLVGAGLLLRSLDRLFAVAPGFDPERLLTMQVDASGHRYDADSSRLQYFIQVLDAVRGVPGVASAAFTSQLPLSGDMDGYGVVFQDAAASGGDEGSALRYAVSPGYFATMGISLRDGRLLDGHDVSGAPEAVLINESFAKRRFPGRSAIGQRMRMGPENEAQGRPWDYVVGVVGDVKQTSLAVAQPDEMYVAAGQWLWVENVQSLVIRARGDAAALVPLVKRAVWSVDADVPITRVATMPELVARSAAERRFALIVFAAFAAAALVLAAIGLYGVLSGSVSERLREIGVRSALGATRGQIVGLVVREGMGLTLVGVAIGLAAAVAASRALVTLLFGVSRLDPLTYAGVIALLAGVSAVACWIPAARAARVDPSITLRAE